MNGLGFTNGSGGGSWGEKCVGIPAEAATSATWNQISGWKINGSTFVLFVYFHSLEGFMSEDEIYLCSGELSASIKSLHDHQSGLILL